MKNLAILFLLVTMSIGVNAQKNKENNPEVFEKTKALVESNKFEVTAEYVFPSGMRSRSLVGNEGHIKINRTQAEGRLPFFGRAYSATYAEGLEGGIVFNDQIKNRKISTKEKKKEKIIVYEFQVRNSADIFDIVLEIFENGNTTTTIYSGKRSIISYSGKITPLN